MNIFTNSNKIEILTQQVNDLTERIEKLEYILRRYPPPYNPYFNFNNGNSAPPQEYRRCAQFKSADCTFEMSQPALVEEVTNRTCGLSSTHMPPNIMPLNVVPPNVVPFNHFPPPDNNQ